MQVASSSPGQQVGVVVRQERQSWPCCGRDAVYEISFPTPCTLAGNLGVAAQKMLETGGVLGNPYISERRSAPFPAQLNNCLFPWKDLFLVNVLEPLLFPLSHTAGVHPNTVGHGHRIVPIVSCCWGRREKDSPTPPSG